MNREQRRRQIKAARGNPDALWCPYCDHKTVHVANKVPKDVDHYDIYCPVCSRWKVRLRLEDTAIGGNNELLGHVLTDRQKMLAERKVV